MAAAVREPFHSRDVVTSDATATTDDKFAEDPAWFAIASGMPIPPRSSLTVLAVQIALDDFRVRQFTVAKLGRRSVGFVKDEQRRGGQLRRFI